MDKEALTKLRRRIEDVLRKSDEATIIKVARLLGHLGGRSYQAGQSKDRLPQGGPGGHSQGPGGMIRTRRDKC